jgi:hypothetical protein
MDTIRLRPHHVLDVVAYWKPDHDPQYARKPGENNQRTFIRMMCRGLDIPAEFVVGWDFICRPCSHLKPDGHCDQILTHHTPVQAMDEYNDPLDRRVLDYLGMQEGDVMTVREYLELVNEHVPGVETVSHRPNETAQWRRDALAAGLVALGIRSSDK